jgi:predicted phosphodiesterase
MKITLFSDVHGNLPALEWVLKHEKDSDQFIFLGDAVNYGAWSNECVELLRGVKSGIRLKGNHEDSFIKGVYEGQNVVAKAFFDFCYPRFTQHSEIKTYIDTYQLLDFQCVHTILDKNIYPDTPLDLNQNYIIGHSHHPFLTSSNGFKLYNTGSVGQNRQFINVISYLNFYPEKGHFEFKNEVYDIDILINEMKAQGYPAICLDYYLKKARK